MNFEKKLKEIAKQIYQKVLKVVNEHQEDDREYCSAAYLKLDDEMEIMYTFAAKGIKLKHKPKNGPINSMEIIGDRMYCKYDYMQYFTDIDEIIDGVSYYVNAYELKNTKIRQKRIQKEYDNKTKEEILNFCESINKKADNMTYDVEETHNVYNLTLRFFSVYQAYMYEKELENMENTGGVVLPAASIAADWFAKRLFTKTSRTLSDEQNDNFKNILSIEIMKSINKTEGFHTIISWPSLTIDTALSKSKISSFEVKSGYYVEVYPYRVKANNQVLYDIREKEDVVRAINKYVEINKQNQNRLKNKIN